MYHKNPPITSVTKMIEAMAKSVLFTGKDAEPCAEAKSTHIKKKTDIPPKKVDICSKTFFPMFPFLMGYPEFKSRTVFSKSEEGIKYFLTEYPLYIFF